MPEKSDLKFPEGFLWGAATASHQVEGGSHNDWSEWENSPARIAALKADGRAAKYGMENYASGRGAGHYGRFREDFALAKSLGHNATRISLEWSRIEPEEGKFDQKEIAHYQDVIAAIRENGMEPFVTLWHWPIPLWLRDQGGWKSPRMPELFARFSERMARELPEVKFWLTLNEPEIYSAQSYLRGEWPPQERSLFGYLRVFHKLIAGHKAAFAAIRKIRPEAQIGIAKNNIYVEAGPDPISWFAKKITDYTWNSYFLNRIRNHMDFVGVNHYFHTRLAWGFRSNQNKVVSDMGWELYPEAIYHVLCDLRKYGKPIYVTENGLADAADSRRPWFLVESLRNVHRAISEGIPVKGYLHWSLMDNFEWDKGFWPRFGLVEIDFRTQERKPRPSAFIYCDICQKNAVSDRIDEALQ